MVQRQWSLADVRRIRLSVWTNISSSFAYEIVGVGAINRDTRKGVNDGKIQAIGISCYFIFRQVAFLGVLDHRI